MDHLHHVVVGVDLSPDETTDMAMDQAVRAAMMDPGIVLHVCHVVTDVDEAMKREKDGSPSLLDERERQLRELVLFKLGGGSSELVSRVHLHLGVGKVVDELIQVAVDLEAERIIVGTRSKKGIGRILGSTAKALTDAAPCPVMVARPFDYETRPKSPSIEPPLPNAARSAGPSDGRQGVSYSYRRTFPLHTHDSNVVPTTIKPEHVF
jgi:nucleotide-binding universal stress UspA family protein